MPRPKPRKTDRLSDPVLAAHAWARYRWIMRWVILTAMLSVVGALLYLRADGSPLTAAMIIATVAGVAFSVLLAGALMGLIFLSAGTGHDADVGHVDTDAAGDDGSQWDTRR